MIGEKTKELLTEAVTEELQSGIAQYGLFHSNHEAIAVLAEELQEAKEVSDNIPSVTEDYNILTLWEAVRNDKMTDRCVIILEEIQSAALMAASEYIQVAAMCEKWLAKIILDGDTDAKIDS